MKMYFSSRSKLRSVASKSSAKKVDLGSKAPARRRWALKIK